MCRVFHVATIVGGSFVSLLTFRNMAKTITINGKELRLAYSMLTAVSYEKMTGKSALDLSQFQNNEIGPVAEIGYCMLLSGNEEKDVPKFDEVLNSLDSVEKLTGFVQAVSEVLIEFYTPNKADQPDKQEDAAKNA